MTFPNGQIIVFANGHAGKIENHPVLKNPAYTSTQITALNQTFSDTVVAATGDPEDTAATRIGKMSAATGSATNDPSASGSQNQTASEMAYMGCRTNR